MAAKEQKLKRKDKGEKQKVKQLSAKRNVVKKTKNIYGWQKITLKSSD